MTDSTGLDPARCPLCGGPNGCAMACAPDQADAGLPCWCTRQTFSAALLERMPADALGRACICARCVAASQAQELR